jgi:hypothetical protein
LGGRTILQMPNIFRKLSHYPSVLAAYYQALGLKGVAAFFSSTLSGMIPLTPPFREDIPFEIKSGAMPYLDFLDHIHEELSPHLYVEIGIYRAKSLALARCHAIGIDPFPDITVQLSVKTKICPETSDDFFDSDAVMALHGRIDLAFIDGMHLSEYALRDFINIERHAHPASVIVFDDIFPNHPLQADRSRKSFIWTGDIWKIIFCLRTHRPDLLLLPINTYPTGLLMVVGLDPGNQQLTEKYTQIIQDFINECPEGQPVPAEILERSGAIAPDDPKIADILRTLRRTRVSGEGNFSLAEQFRIWRATCW